MLEVQQYLRDGRTIEGLIKEYHLKPCYNEEKTLVLLNYDQLESPKTANIVRECRSIILEVGSWDLISFAFYRFFNYGENEEEKIFNWDDFTCMEKMDGSFTTLYHYNGWKCHTRGMIEASGSMGVFPVTFKDKFFELLAQGNGLDSLNKDCCYTIELCSIFNKVVRIYKKPQLFLLSSFNKKENLEVSLNKLKKISTNIGVELPKIYQFKSYTAIEEFLLDQAAKDPTYEGVVVRDSNNVRLKIKSISYLKLHRLSDGKALFALKNLVPLVMVGEIDEIVAYMKEVELYARKINEQIHLYKQDLLETWEEIKNIEDKKEFAMLAKDKKFSGMLFGLHQGRFKTVDEAFLPADKTIRDRTFRYIIETLQRDEIEQYAEESIKVDAENTLKEE